MCIICAAIPATAAVGAKLNADQLQNPGNNTNQLPGLQGLPLHCWQQHRLCITH